MICPQCGAPNPHTSTDRCGFVCRKCSNRWEIDEPEQEEEKEVGDELAEA
jgi:tRNA(Ile2) C34 agmatinyltransferase TiaS